MNRQLPQNDSWKLTITGTNIWECVDEFSLLTFFSALPLARKINRKKINFRYFTAIFNCKASNYSPIMPSQSSLLHLHPTLVSTTGDAAKLTRNASLFGGTVSTPNPDLKKAQRQILLSALSSLKDPDLSIAWSPYQ